MRLGSSSVSPPPRAEEFFFHGGRDTTTTVPAGFGVIHSLNGQVGQTTSNKDRAVLMRRPGSLIDFAARLPWGIQAAADQFIQLRKNNADVPGAVMQFLAADPEGVVRVKDLNVPFVVNDYFDFRLYHASATAKQFHVYWTVKGEYT